MQRILVGTTLAFVLTVILSCHEGGAGPADSEHLELIVVCAAPGPDGPWGCSSGVLVDSTTVLACRHSIDGNVVAFVRTAGGETGQVQYVLVDDPTHDLILLGVASLDLSNVALPLSTHDPGIGTSVVASKLDPYSLQNVNEEGVVAEITEFGIYGRTIITTIPAAPGWSGAAIVDQEGRFAGFVNNLERCGASYCAAAVPVACVADFLALPRRMQPLPAWSMDRSSFGSPEERDRAIRARDHALAGELPAAIHLLEPIVNDLAESGRLGRDLRLMLAAFHLDAGEHDKAIKVYRDWLMLSEYDCGAMHALYVAYRTAGDAHGAMAIRKQLDQLHQNGSCECKTSPVAGSR